MSIANLIKCVGLVTYGSEISRAEGSLRQALNVNIDEDGVITPRRGFNEYGLPTTGSANTNKTVDQIMEYKNSIIRQFDNSLEYEDTNNTFQSVNGTFTPIRSGYRTKFQESNSNLYFTSNEGIKKISETSQANLNSDMVKSSGGIKAGYAEGIVVPTVGGFLPPQSKVAYRVLFGTKDNNNNLIYGSPSSRFIVTNFAEDRETYEVQTITFDTGTGGAISNGDHFIFYSGTVKYVVWFKTPSGTPPKTSLTIGGTYIEVDADGITSNDSSLANFTANEIANNISNITVTSDNSSKITITQQEIGNVTDISDGYNASGSLITTKIAGGVDVQGETVDGLDVNVEVTGIVPNGATTDYFYQIYRTAPITAVTGLTLNDIDPGDEMNLVYEAGLTDAEITANEFSITDTTPDSFRNSGLPLYTNEASGEGILQANDVPPIALDLELFKNYMFYGNTKQTHQLEFTVVSVDNFVSGSTKLVIGNDDITRFYTFTGTSQIVDIDIDSVPTAGDYINLYSANDIRKYYIYFGETSDDPDISGFTSYRISLDDSPSTTDIATRIETALVDNVDFDIETSSNTVTFTYTNNGTTTGITNGVGTDITINSPSVTGTGEETGTDEGGKILLSGLTSVGQAIDETARSIVKVISSDINSPVNAYYLSTGEELPGEILLEARSLEDLTFYIGIEESSDTSIGDEFTPELPYSKPIEEFTGTGTICNIQLTGHGYSTGDVKFIGIQESNYDNSTAYTSAASDVVEYNGNIYECILDTTGNTPSGDNTDNTYWQYISPEFSGTYTITRIDDDNFSIVEIVPSSTVSFIPTYSTIHSGEIFSDNEELANRVYYSKFKQPEAVPRRVNFIDIGPQDSQVLRILALRDELYVLKEDGVYVISGSSAPDPQTGAGGWSVRLIDSAQLLAPDSAVILNNQIYCLSDQGIIRISGSSAAVISRGIENRINNIVDSDYDYTTNTFGVAYENDRAYVLFTPQQSSDTSATQAYRYNIFEKTWSRWEYEAHCGLVLKRDNKMYLGNETRNYISQERKNNNRTDYSDRDFEATIVTNGVNSTTLELSTLVNISVNDVILQSQDVTIYYINWKLLKKMDLFDTGITPPSGFDTMYEAFAASSGDDLSTVMQNINDHLVTLDAWDGSSGFTAKSFNLSNLKTNTDLLVDELNISDTITTRKTYKYPETVNYEAYITEIDRRRNLVTIHTERPFVEGDISIYKGYTCTIEWNPLHFGNPAALKQVSHMTIMFDQNNFNAAIAKFYSDASQGVIEIPFSGKGVGYWGDMAWGENTAYWGGKGNDMPYRTIVPRGKQKCRYISIAFEHKIARESFRVLGVSGDVRQISSKAYKQLK